MWVSTISRIRWDGGFEVEVTGGLGACGALMKKLFAKEQEAGAYFFVVVMNY